MSIFESQGCVFPPTLVMVPKTLLFLSPLIVSAICLNFQSYNTISVDPSSGRDDSPCLDPLSGIRCATLSYALRYANHSTLYLLSAAGDHSLVAGEPNTLANLRDITIASNGTSSTVRCARNAGLSFKNVSSLAIENVVFFGCGTSHNSTSRNLSDTKRTSTLLKFTVALYFQLCDSVTLCHVTVTNSFGMGVIMYDTTGKNLISNSEFSNNVVQDRATPGGGGFCIEFTYSTPGDFCAPSSLQHNTGSRYDFTNSTFIGNVADDGSVNVPTFIIPYACNHDAFGKGGGLALFFKGSASDNTVRLSNCTFQNNTAVWGGGLYAEFHDAAMGNVIEIESTFSNNSAVVEGGGLRVAYYTPGDNQNIGANNFTLRSTTFMNNDAFTGGAIAVLPSLLSAEDPTPQILVFNCTFESNIAELGSAVYGSYIALSSVSLITPVIDFQMCTFTNNFLHVQEDRRVAEHYIGIGAVYLNGLHATFNGAILFTNNSGSALAVVGAYVDFTSSNVSFFNNTGDKGGAISLLGDASMLISNYTNARFEGNRVSTYGGAIYNSYIERESFSSYSKCFIRYNPFFVPPDQWTAHFIFRNNTASISGNSIYSTSILPCSLFTATPNESRTVFCWNVTFWNYDDNCTDEIGTGFGKLSAGNAETYPGMKYKLPISITDELGHDIKRHTAFITTIGTQDPQPVATVDPGFYVAVDGIIQLNGNGSANQTIILTLEGTGNGMWHSEITVQLFPCPPGLSQDTNDQNDTCKCDPSKTFNSIVFCLGGNSVEFAALIKVGYWMGFAPELSRAELVVATCPQGFCKNATNGASVFQLSDTYIYLPLNATALDSVVCAPNRMGFVCGECVPSYAPSINDDAYSCVPCDSAQLEGNVFKYIGIVYIPLVLLFLVIILFNVKLTTGPANAFILFSQAIVSSFDATFSSQLTIGSDIYKGTMVYFKSCSFIYRVFNLDFFAYLLDPFCIGTQLSTLDVIELNYVVAIVPCVMILIVMACYQVTKLTCIFKICCWNRRHENRGSQKLSCTKAISFSPILAFAAFLLLSYNKVSITASKVLSQVRFRDASGLDIGVTRSYYAAQYDSGYWRYALPSSFITVLIIVLPIILLGFPVRLFEKCISRVPAIMKHYPADKINIFLDAFQGCFLDNRRYFASAYFFFRLIVNVVFIFLPSVSLQYTCQQFLCIAMVALIVFLQPYKVVAYNFIDILIFSNLAFISILNGYIIQYSSDLNQREIINALLVIFSILISLPLIYMVAYLIWHFLVEPKKDKIVSILLSPVQKYFNVNKTVVNNSEVTTVHFERNNNQEDNVSVNMVTNASGDLEVFDARMHEQVRNADKSPFPSN